MASLSIRVLLTLMCALSLAFALPVNAQTSCPTICGTQRSTAMGIGALSSNTTGENNTATGFTALRDNTEGSGNTAMGSDALERNTTGKSNTATGDGALARNTTGGQNTAMGSDALVGNTTGGQNTACGGAALLASTTGSFNTALGYQAGANVTTGSNNIHIGDEGTVADFDLIRIGTVGIQTRTFIAGIFGASALGNALPVEVGSDGQLGTVISSRRMKDDIRDMEEASAGLGKLRPVTFRYKAAPAHGSRPLEYGLIAEEVAEIYPELVVLDKHGQPAGVRYHVLPAMLLNEVQKQHAQLREQTARLDAQQKEIDELRAQVRALVGGKAAVRE